ncbi:Tripartite tricarboxylate transporter TctA family protein [uncultured archaeon]|nr:Tripartite tricarboxylate transporter TctA family protein [uncultured archaeon]
MIDEAALAVAGIAAGAFAGLVPGIHANTIAFLVVALPVQKGPGFAFFIVSMAIVNSIVDCVPSILLGATSDENANIMLPGHEMLMDGNGLEAVALSSLGAAFAVAIAVALSPFFFSVTQNYASTIPGITPVLVAAAFVAMVACEKNKVSAISLGLLCGCLGIIASEKTDNFIFALITGFFGITGLVEAILSKAKLPPQKEFTEVKIEAGTALLATAASGFTAIFPGIGPTQATTAIRGVFSGIGKKGHLVLTGAMNTGNIVFSLLMLFALGKGRSGAAVAIQSFATVDFGILLAMLATAVMGAGVGLAIAMHSAKIVLAFAEKINYGTLSAVVLVFMLSLVWIFSGPLGMLACITAACLALFGISSKVHRSQCMAFLLFPTMIFYLGI